MMMMMIKLMMMIRKMIDDFDDANSNVNSANKQQRVATRSQKKKPNTIDYQWRLCRESRGTN